MSDEQAILTEIRNHRSHNKEIKRSIVDLSEEVSELEYQRVKKQSVLNAIKMKMNIEKPVDNV